MHQKAIVIIVSYMLLLVAIPSLYCVDGQISAKDPFMGWNSYDCYSVDINEKQFKACVDTLAEKLLPYGYMMKSVSLK